MKFFLENAWDFVVSGYTFVAVIFLTAHILLPTQMIHPLQVVITCSEKGCEWEARGKDRGGFFTMRLLQKLKARHKEHYLLEHPDKEWIYG